MKIWQVEKFVESDSGRILYSIPDEAPPRVDTTGEAALIPETQFQGGKTLRFVMDAGLLRPGQQLWMEYGPRGKPTQKFAATVREDGLEVDGRVYSPSYATVACMRKSGGRRKNANGWRHWRTEDGTLIDELYRRAASEDA